MGRLIDADKFKEFIESGVELAFFQAPLKAKKVEELADCIIDDIDAQPTVEAIPKADYETRLKADMMAMLKELSMKIGEIEDGYAEFDEENKRSLTMIPLESVERLIDREINSLKGDKNGSMGSL